MSFVSASSPGAKGLGISVRQVQQEKSLPHLPKQHSLASSKGSRTSTGLVDDKSSRSCIQTIYRYECDTWAFEVFNIVLSMAALATVLVALRYYDGKTAPEWPYSLTLNAFISVCMMVMGAALTVPVSNGIGQVKWLLARKGTVSMVDLDTLDRASRGMWGSVCAIFAWSGGLLGSFGSIVTIVAFAASPFAQQAIISEPGSVKTAGDPQSFVSTCGPSSDLTTICTGSSVTGAAARGLNVVPTLLRGGFYSAIYGTYNSSVAASDLATCSKANCTWEPFTTLSLCSSCLDVTPFLVSVESGVENDQRFELPGGPSIGVSFDTFQVGATEPSTRIETTNVTAYTFAVLEANTEKKVRALECKIDFCVQTLQATLSSGVYNETVLQQSTKHRQFQLQDPTKFTPPVYYEFTPMEGIASVQNGPISIDRGQPGCLGGLLNFDPREIVALTELGLDRIETMLKNVIISASRSIRTVCKGSTRLPGTTLEIVTRVRITWWWLLLPVIVELLGISFFVWVAVLNKTSDATIWKSSLLAALFHSIDSKELDEHSNLERLYGMEQISEKMSIRLSKGTVTNRSKLIRQ